MMAPIELHVSNLRMDGLQLIFSQQRHLSNAPYPIHLHGIDHG